MRIKDIDGYKGLYQISDDGRVWNVIKKFWLKASVGSSGYLLVHLRKAGKVTTHSVHRLVAKAFVPNINNKDEVNHLNENKKDNRAENLEWVTKRENLIYGNRIKRMIEKERHEIEQRNIDGSYINTYFSISDASRKTGIEKSSISKCVRGKYKTAGGYIWKLS